MQQNNFIFFGTPLVSSRTLEVLVSAGYIPKAVVTNPDARRGRGMELQPSPVKECAKAHGIPVLTPERLDEGAQKEILSYGASYAVVVAYGKIFPEELITAFPLGVLNVHYSLLPKYRGATPTEAALLHGDTETGVTIQQMVRKLDAGDILAQRSIEISPDETTKELRPRLIELGAELLVETLPEYVSGRVTPIPQEARLATTCGKLSKEDGLLDLSASAIENWNKYRAYAEWPGTYFFIDGTRVKITKAELRDGVFTILRVIPEGKKEMDYTTFRT